MRHRSERPFEQHQAQHPPKSATLMSPFASSRMFSGFRSRWTAGSGREKDGHARRARWKGLQPGCVHRPHARTCKPGSSSVQQHPPTHRRWQYSRAWKICRKMRSASPSSSCRPSCGEGRRGAAVAALGRSTSQRTRRPFRYEPHTSSLAQLRPESRKAFLPCHAAAGPACLRRRAPLQSTYGCWSHAPELGGGRAAAAGQGAVGGSLWVLDASLLTNGDPPAAAAHPCLTPSRRTM